MIVGNICYKKRDHIVSKGRDKQSCGCIRKENMRYIRKYNTPKSIKKEPKEIIKQKCKLCNRVSLQSEYCNSCKILKNSIGKKYNKLTILEFAYIYTSKLNATTKYVKCLCDCR